VTQIEQEERKKADQTSKHRSARTGREVRNLPLAPEMKRTKTEIDEPDVKEQDIRLAEFRKHAHFLKKR
jgi:hypothetical protein